MSEADLLLFFKNPEKVVLLSMAVPEWPAALSVDIFEFLSQPHMVLFMELLVLLSLPREEG